MIQPAKKMHCATEEVNYRSARNTLAPLQEKQAIHNQMTPQNPTAASFFLIGEKIPAQLPSVAEEAAFGPGDRALQPVRTPSAHIEKITGTRDAAPPRRT
jgi:hypothetical protein